MKLTFSEYNDEVLLCPHCKSEYLHHDSIEIYNRDEDDTKGLHIEIKHKDYTVDDELLGNPSSRRHGLRVTFWCESCNAISALSFSQHKGATFLWFDYFLGADKEELSHKERYHEYLRSEEWNQKRLLKLKEADYSCQLCNRKARLSVHHRTYERVFNELQSDLIALCSDCHSKHHEALPLLET